MGTILVILSLVHWKHNILTSDCNTSRARSELTTKPVNPIKKGGFHKLTFCFICQLCFTSKSSNDLISLLNAPLGETFDEPCLSSCSQRETKKKLSFQSPDWCDVMIQCDSHRETQEGYTKTDPDFGFWTKPVGRPDLNSDAFFVWCPAWNKVRRKVETQIEHLITTRSTGKSKITLKI